MRTAATATTRPATTQPALPKEVVERLRSLPAASLTRPAELADELFRSGYTRAAFALYERALADDADADTKAWALYQMANCRKADDPAQAEQLYLRVSAEHSQTVWAVASAIERKLLLWVRVNQPGKLLESIRSVGTASTAGPTSQPTTRPTTQPTTRATGTAGALGG